MKLSGQDGLAISTSQQTTFDWPRLAQLRLLRQLTFPRWVRIPNDPRRIDGAYVKSLLRTIDDHAGRAGWCFCNQTTLARETCCSRRQIQRLFRFLDAEALIIHRRDTCRGRQYRIRLHWPALAEYADIDVDQFLDEIAPQQTHPTRHRPANRPATARRRTSTPASTPHHALVKILAASLPIPPTTAREQDILARAAAAAAGPDDSRLWDAVHACARHTDSAAVYDSLQAALQNF